MPAINMRRIQIGRQTAFATPVAATVLMRGVTDASFDLINQSSVVEEIGFAAGSTIVPASYRMAEGSLTFVPSYQDVRYVLQGVFGAPVTTGSADPFTHTWAAPALTALPAPQIYTVEYGTTGAEYRAVGTLIGEFTLTSTAGESVSCEASLVAREIQANAMTTGLSPRAVDALSHVHAGLWIDPQTSAYGTTAFTASLIRAEWMVNTGRHMKLFAGSRNPQDWGDARWESTVTLELEYTTSPAVKALVDSLLSNEILRRIRLRWQLSASRSLTVDFFGTLVENPSLFGDRDGNMTVELVFSATVDTVSGVDRWVRVELLNNENALP